VPVAENEVSGDDVCMAGNLEIFACHDVDKHLFRCDNDTSYHDVLGARLFVARVFVDKPEDLFQNVRVPLQGSVGLCLAFVPRRKLFFVKAVDRQNAPLISEERDTRREIWDKSTLAIGQTQQSRRRNSKSGREKKTSVERRRAYRSQGRGRHA
jgi:hypothetical protein